MLPEPVVHEVAEELLRRCGSMLKSFPKAARRLELEFSKSANMLIVVKPPCAKKSSIKTRRSGDMRFQGGTK